MEHTVNYANAEYGLVMERPAGIYQGAAPAADSGRHADVIGFTSGTGGAGTSSAALMLAQNYSELCGLETVYLSLDLLSSKACWQNGPTRALFDTFFSGEEAPDPKRLFVRDGCGVYRLPSDGPRNPMTLAAAEDQLMIIDRLRSCFDKIILDIPASCLLESGILDACSCMVVCFGWQDKLYGQSEELYLMLSADHGNVHRFFCFHDEDEPDLYGQLGSEVRRLAKEL